MSPNIYSDEFKAEVLYYLEENTNLTIKEVADYWEIKPGTLRQWKKRYVTSAPRTLDRLPKTVLEVKTAKQLNNVLPVKTAKKPCNDDVTEDVTGVTMISVPEKVVLDIIALLNAKRYENSTLQLQKETITHLLEAYVNHGG